MSKRKRQRRRYQTLAVLRVTDYVTLRMEVFYGVSHSHCRVILVETGEWLWSSYGRNSDIREYGYSRLWEWAMSVLKKLAGKASERGASIGKPDGASKKRYPELVELLTDATAPDGNARELSTVTIKWQDGTWRAAVHEPNLEMSLWASASSLEGALEALEQRINAEDADWRAWTKFQAKTSGKGKK